MIDKIIQSPNKSKRFRAILSNGKNIDFGSRGANTYVDGASDINRINYLKRHSTNPLERNKINDFTTVTPSLLSAHVLWGEYRSIKKNVDELNKRIS